jgi:hypothetical protein
MFTPQTIDPRKFTHGAPRQRNAPLTVKLAKATLLKTAHIFSSGIHRQGNVYLLNGVERIHSLRAEHEGQMYPECTKPTYYRANVYNTVTKEWRLVDLAANYVVKVVS